MTKSRHYSETLGIREEKPFFEVFTDTIERDENNRYQVKLPFKEDHPIISDNYKLSKQRLLNLLSKLQKQPEILKKYDDVFKEQMQAGIIEPANEPGNISGINYYNLIIIFRIML